MQTRTELITHRTAEYVTATYKNASDKHITVGERPGKAGQLLLAGKVRRLGPELYEVESGEKRGKVYKVNGLCSCPDATKAPGGWCKHRLAGRYFDLIERDLRLLRESRIPHAHRYVCAEHTIPEIDCWEQSCTDPVEIPCPICAKTRPVASSDTAEVDAATGEIIEDAEVPYPVIASASTGDTAETPFPEEDDTMMSTLGETVTQVIERLRGSRNGSAPEPVVIETTPEVEAEPLPPVIYKPEQYEEAPVIQADEIVPFLPEAGASLNIKVRMEQFEIMYTMRGHTDPEVLERLPQVLATLERLMHSEVDHDMTFLQRLAHAFFPRKKAYSSGK